MMGYIMQMRMTTEKTSEIMEKTLEITGRISETGEAMDIEGMAPTTENADQVVAAEKGDLKSLGIIREVVGMTAPETATPSPTTQKTDAKTITEVEEVKCQGVTPEI